MTELKDTLFEEKSLSDLLKVFESAFPVPLPAKMFGFWAGLMTLLCTMAAWCIQDLELIDLQMAAGLMASFALTVSSALMGAVIAGMSIFAASLKPKVANGLIETPYPGTDVSSLKFIFSMFAYILISLFVMIVACAIYYVVLGNSALILKIAPQFSDNETSSNLIKFFLVLYVSILLGLIVFLGSILRSFIWNLHQVLMVVAVFNGRTDS